MLFFWMNLYPQDIQVYTGDLQVFTGLHVFTGFYRSYRPYRFLQACGMPVETILFSVGIFYGK